MSDAARAIWKIGPGQKDPRMNSRVDNVVWRDTTDEYFNFALGDPPLPSRLSLPFTIPPFLESRRRARARVRTVQGTLYSVSHFEGGARAFLRDLRPVTNH